MTSSTTTPCGQQAQAAFQESGPDTPRTNEIIVEGHTQEDVYRLLHHARQLERELADAQWALEREQAANKGATDEIARLLTTPLFDQFFTASANSETKAINDEVPLGYPATFAASANRESIPVSEIEAEIDHIKQNAEGLRHFTGHENEARCRELCAMYLREFIQSWRYGEQLKAMNHSSDSRGQK